MNQVPRTIALMAPGDMGHAVGRVLVHAGCRVITNLEGRSARTRALAAMHMVGRLIPHRHHRAPSIVPINESELRQQLDSTMADGGWRVSNDRRVSSGFYISQAMELRRR